VEVGEPVTGEGPGKAEPLLKDVLKSNFVLFSRFFGSHFPAPQFFVRTQKKTLDYYLI